MMNGVINENRRAIDKDCTSGRKGFSCSQNVQQQIFNCRGEQGFYGDDPRVCIT